MSLFPARGMVVERLIVLLCIRGFLSAFEAWLLGFCLSPLVAWALGTF